MCVRLARTIALLFSLVCACVVTTGAQTLFDLPSILTKSNAWSPGQCVVVVAADGLGVSHAVRASDAWWRGTTVPPEGNAADVVNGLRGGCDAPLWTHFARARAAYGLVSSKCVNDGTAAGFLVTVQDRYDLETASADIVALDPPPFLLSGGFTRPLWRRAFEAPFMEFDSSGATAFAETCEYPSPSALPARVDRALALGARAGAHHGYFVVVADASVDMAAHAGDGAKLNASLLTLETIMHLAADTLNRTCIGAWRVVVFGSHATGGINGTHRHHSPAGTAVPVFVIGRDAQGNDLGRAVGRNGRRALTFDEIARVIAPSRRCGSAGRGLDPSAPVARHLTVRRPDTRGGAVAKHQNYYTLKQHAHTEWESIVYVYFIVLFLIPLSLVTCVPRAESYVMQREPNVCHE